MKAGEKSLRRFAAEESHQYYEQAFYILTDIPDKTWEEKALLVDLLVDWSMVFYYRADFRGWYERLSSAEEVAESLGDKARLGTFYVWLGWPLFFLEKYRESYQYLNKSLKLGEEIEDERLIGYACAVLPWICSELGLLDEAVLHGERAVGIYRRSPSDPYLYFKSAGGTAFAYWLKGERKKCLDAGKAILEFGHAHSNIRSMTMGHMCMGFSYAIAGDFQSAAECCQRAVEVAVDPLYYHYPLMILGLFHVQNGNLQDAKEASEAVVSFCRDLGTDVMAAVSRMVLGIVSIAQGRMSEGLRTLEEVNRAYLENERRCLFAMSEYILGSVHLQVVQGEGDLSLSMMSKNIGFLIKNVPFAAKKAESHFNKAIEVAEEIGAKGTLAQAYLDLGRLHKAKKRKDKARKCVTKAIEYFELCEAETFLKQAREELASLG